MLFPRTMMVLVTALTLLLGANAGFAGDFKDNPGYMDLEWIDIPSGADEVRDIDLSTMLLSVAADAQNKGYDEIAEALGLIESIRVKSFSLTENDTRKTEKIVEKIVKKLEDGDWNRLIYVKDKGEMVTVSTKDSKDGTMAGIMLVAFEPDNEVTFANIVGDLNLTTLFRLISLMDSEEFEDIVGDLDIDGDIHID